MSLALALTAAIALIAVVALVFTVLRTNGRVATERARAESLDAQRLAAVEAGAGAERQAQQAEHDRDVARERADGAEHERDLARERADGAEQERDLAREQADAVERTDAPERAVGADPVDSADPAGASDVDRSELLVTTATNESAAATALWELERVRLEREWADVAGAPVPLPVPWDGSLWAAVAVELQIIREEIGTPSELEPLDAPLAVDPATAAAAGRLTIELLRRVAKEGDHLSVSFGDEPGVAVAIAVEGSDPKPDLHPLAQIAAQLDGELTVSTTPAELRVQLHLPAANQPTA